MPESPLKQPPNKEFINPMVQTMFLGLTFKSWRNYTIRYQEAEEAAKVAGREYVEPLTTEEDLIEEVDEEDEFDNSDFQSQATRSKSPSRNVSPSMSRSQSQAEVVCKSHPIARYLTCHYVLAVSRVMSRKSGSHKEISLLHRGATPERSSVSRSNLRSISRISEKEQLQQEMSKLRALEGLQIGSKLNLTSRQYLDHSSSNAPNSQELQEYLDVITKEKLRESISAHSIDESDSQESEDDEMEYSVNEEA